MKSKRISPRLLVLLAVLLICIFIYFSGVLAPNGIEVEIKRKTIIKSNYDFIYEHWKEEKLNVLRENEDFVKIKEANQFTYFLKLCDWVHQQWERSIPDPYPLSNAIAVLADIRSGKTGGFCGQYAYVLGDVLKSLGFFNVRYVELWSSRGKDTTHFVVEVWSDRFEKWIILDPDYNIYYEIENSGIPANAYDIRQSLFKGPKVKARPIDPSQKVKEDEHMHLYANFAVSLRSDLMRHTKPLTIGDRFDMFLFFIDKHTTDFYSGGGIPYAHVTERKQDLYFDCNAARAEYVMEKNTGDVILSFFTEGSMPNFKHFAISKDTGKTWSPLQGNQYRVKKSQNPVTLLVVPVNMYGRPGCMNRIVVRF